MKKIIWFLFSILCMLFIGCATQKRCNDKFPPQLSTITVVKDSIRCVHDTINLPGVMVEIHDSIPCPELVYHKEFKKGRLTETVDIKKGVLTASCKEDSLNAIIDRMEHDKLTYTKEVQVHETVKEVVPWYYKMIAWGFGISFALNLILIIIYEARRK